MLEAWFLTRAVFPTRDTRQCLQAFLVVTMEGCCWNLVDSQGCCNAQDTSLQQGISVKFKELLVRVSTKSVVPL